MSQYRRIVFPVKEYLSKFFLLYRLFYRITTAYFTLPELTLSVVT